MRNPKTKVYVVEEISLMRVKTIEYLARTQKYQVVGATDCVDMVYESIIKLKPDIILVNKAIFDMNDDGLLQKLKQAMPGVKIIVSTYTVNNQKRIPEKCAHIDFYINRSDFYKELNGILIN